MAGNTRMNENERGVFSFIHGITGMLVAVVLLLVVLFIMVSKSIIIQNNESQNYYKINQDIDALKTISESNQKYYELIQKKE